MNPFPLFSGFSGLPHVGIVKYRVLCGYKGNNKCAWMETVTQMCRGDFKIRAHLGDTNRMFSFVVILLPSIHHLSIRVVRSTPKSILSKSKDTVLKCYFSSKIIKYLIEKKKLGIKLQVTVQLLLSIYLSICLPDIKLITSFSSTCFVLYHLWTFRHLTLFFAVVQTEI